MTDSQQQTQQLPLLRVEELSVRLRGEAGIVHAVSDVTFQLQRGQTLGIVGESGCGKSVTALSILRLLPVPAGRIESGKVLFDGKVP